MKTESKFARAVPNPDADRAAREAGRRLIEDEIALAKLLDTMTVDYAYATLGCSSIGHYGMLLGLSQKQARLLADAGRAFALAPDLEAEVRCFAVTIEAAAALARILDDQRFKAEAEKWRTLARSATPPALMQAITRAIAEADAEQVVEQVILLLKPEVRDKMGRVREIMSRIRAITGPVSNETVVEMTIDYFLEHEDPDRTEPGTRRKESTVCDPSRAIPAEVKRNILETRGRKCQVGGCENHLYLYLGPSGNHRDSCTEGGEAPDPARSEEEPTPLRVGDDEGRSPGGMQRRPNAAVIPRRAPAATSCPTRMAAAARRTTSGWAALYVTGCSTTACSPSRAPPRTRSLETGTATSSANRGRRLDAGRRRALHRGGAVWGRPGQGRAGG